MKYSIIVPTYNREKLLKKCIESVLNQTYQNFELIVVDDGSTDNTKKLVKSYNDDRLKYYENDNHGIAYSRNFGIEKATGDYLFFLDSDDYVDYDFLDVVDKNIKKNDILIFDYREIFEKNNVIKENRFEKFEKYTLNKHPELINVINLGPCNKIYKKDLFKDPSNRFPMGMKYEDFSLVIKLFKDAKSISSIGDILTNVVVHEGNETLTVDEKVFDIFLGLNIVKMELSEDVYQEEIKKLIVKKITTYTVSQRTQKHKKIGNSFINEAFKYLKINVPDYKDNKYYENRPFLKRTIEKSKLLTKIYCRIYKIFK